MVDLRELHVEEDERIGEELKFRGLEELMSFR